MTNIWKSLHEGLSEPNPQFQITEEVILTESSGEGITSLIDGYLKSGYTVTNASYSGWMARFTLSKVENKSHTLKNSEFDSALTNSIKKGTISGLEVDKWNDSDSVVIRIKLPMPEENEETPEDMKAKSIKDVLFESLAVFDSEGNFTSSMKLDFHSINENDSDPKENNDGTKGEFDFLLESSKSRRKTFVNACTPERKQKVIDFLKSHDIDCT